MKKLRATVFVSILTGFSVIAAQPALELLEVKKIWDKAPHNAFTDLVYHQGEFICVFREGSSHVPGSNGVIRVIKSKDAIGWESSAVVAEKGVDLRDPKISATPDNRLMLLMGGSYYAGEERPTRRKLLRAHTRVAFSKDGISWTAPQPVSLPDNEWLWRISWNKGIGYGFSYNVGVPEEKMRLILWRTKDGVNYEKVVEPAVPSECHPDETTIRFLPDDTAIALVRNELNHGPAYLGKSLPPYTNWFFVNGGSPAQGPNFIILEDRTMIYAGRSFSPGSCTAVGLIEGDKLQQKLILPGKGDNSYPGLVWHNGTLYVSYYSTHEGKTSIYLAKIRLKY